MLLIKTMLFLILDTSTDRSFAAVARNDTILKSSFLPFGRRSSQFLFDEIEKLFSSLGISPSDLHAVASGVGPGSFTGIRIAQAAARGIAFAQNIPLIGFSSLSCFTSPANGHFVSMMEVKKGIIYYIYQQRIENKIIQLSDLVYCPFAEFPFKTLPCYGPTAMDGRVIEINQDMAFLASSVYRRLELGDFTTEGKLELIYHSS